jgi:hypothetical protein
MHTRRFLLGAVISIALLLGVTSSASALTFGLNWDGNHHSQTELLNAVQTSGATVYHVPLGNFGSGNWADSDALVENAWRRGVTVVPTLGGGRFLLSTNPAWGEWGTRVREVAERYGINGSFWNGKAHPTPITAWEVWNEPNLVENNPLISKKQCESLGQTWYEKQNTCIQPQNYGIFLKYTAEQIQAGSYAKTAHGTEVLFGGINMVVGEGWEPFLGKARAYGGLSAAVTGIAIHPYSFAGGAAEMAGKVTGLRTYLDTWLESPEKTIWITEIGWPVAGTIPAGHTVSEPEQASLLTESFNWVKANASADKIQNVDWYNARDFGGATWDGYCGLLREDGTQRASWSAFQQEAGVVPSSLIGMISTEGKFFAKEQSAGSEWLQVSEGISSIAVAGDRTNGVLLSELSAGGKFNVKGGNIGAEWLQVSEGISSIAVASDPDNGPLLGEVSTSGNAYVKEGSLGEWTQVSEGIKSIAVASDPVNGPLIGIVTTDGKFYAKEGSIGAEWVLESEGIASIALASDPVNGPLIAELSTEGQFYAREGSLVAPWVHIGSGIKQIAVASDPVNGPLIAELFTGGQYYAKQGGLEAPWVFESEGISSIAVASDPIFGPLIGEVAPSGLTLVKEGSLETGWIGISPAGKSLSLAG